MPRTANPNKEKIETLKSEIKGYDKDIKVGEKSAEKKIKAEAALEKLKGGETKEVEKKPAKKTEKVSTKKTTKDEPEKKRPGRPKKVVEEEPVAKRKKKIIKKKKTDDDDDED